MQKKVVYSIWFPEFIIVMRSVSQPDPREKSEYFLGFFENDWTTCDYLWPLVTTCDHKQKATLVKNDYKVQVILELKGD